MGLVDGLREGVEPDHLVGDERRGDGARDINHCHRGAANVRDETVLEHGANVLPRDSVLVPAQGSGTG